MREALEEAQAEARIVALDREIFDHEDEIGYVVGMGPSHFMLLRISDGIQFDGFSIFRIDDVSQVEVPHEHEAFVEGALRLRGENVEAPPEIDLTDTASVLRSAGRLFGVVALHTEERDAEVCQIGHIQSVSEDSFSLVEIDPDADWAEESLTLAVSDVTRVDVGGGYEEALLLVGGQCSVPKLRSVD